MSLELWLVYLIAIIFLCLTPGPNSLLALSNGARYGVRKTVYSSLGCAVGSALIVALSLSSLGLVLAASPAFFMLIKTLGALYLIYLGISLIFSKSSGLELTADEKSANTKNWQLFIHGFAVVVTNPKALLFFIAFLPQFYNISAPLLPQYFLLAATFVVIEFPLELTLAAFSSKFINDYYSPSRLTHFNRATGAIFIFAGVYLFSFERE